MEDKNEAVLLLCPFNYRFYLHVLRLVSKPFLPTPDYEHLFNA